MLEERGSYILKAELRGHVEDVRSLLVCKLGLLTGSRDKTFKLWRKGANGYEIENTYVGHESYVTALQYIPAGLLPGLPDGAIVSGSRDATVKLWNRSTCEVMQTFSGHKYQVTDLAIMPDGSIVSASLDSSLRVWRDNKCVLVLEGHEGAVQCVVCLPSGEIVSGSNDTTIRVWRDGKCIDVLKGHTDTVRGLTLLPGLGVVSASHDQTLRVWTSTGECLATLCGHSAIIYRAAASSTGFIASAAEDNTARLWQADGTALQSIEHPGCVWDVAFLPDGDLVTACADYVARVWTVSPDQAAPAEQIKAYEALLAERKASAAAASGSSAESGLPEGLQLEPETALLQPGKKPGDMKVIREGGTGMVYTWDADRGQWEKIGEVVGGPAQNDTMDVPSKWHNGQQYDFVVDVDFEDGVPPKKLAFNRSDNPYNVAERFLAEEELPMTYRQQVVDYILNLMGRDTALPSAAPANVDPFTSSGAYVAGASAFPAPGRPSSSSDPFTGSGAYAPAVGSMHQPEPNGSIVSQGADKAPQHIPATSYIVFSNVPKLEAIRSKLCEFNSMLSALPEKISLTLGEADVAPGGTLDIVLARAVESTTSGNAAALSKEEGQALHKLLCWPADHLFPALDIARMLVLSQATADALAASAGSFQPGGSGGIGGALATAGVEPQLPSNLQTGLRLACNLFKHASTQQWIQGACMAVIDAYSAAGASSNKAVRTSWASFLVNMSLMLCPPSHAASQSAPTTSEEQAMILSAAAELLSTCPEDDSETVARMHGAPPHRSLYPRSLRSDLDGAPLNPLYALLRCSVLTLISHVLFATVRALLAAGTIMHSTREQKSMGRDLGLVDYAQKYKGSPNAKVASIAAEILVL